VIGIFSLTVLAYLTCIPRLSQRAADLYDPLGRQGHAAAFHLPYADPTAPLLSTTLARIVLLP